eukprot:2874277-Pyramimonas_sp.AAC.1
MANKLRLYDDHFDGAGVCNPPPKPGLFRSTSGKALRFVKRLSFKKQRSGADRHEPNGLVHGESK